MKGSQKRIELNITGKPYIKSNPYLRKSFSSSSLYPGRFLETELHLPLQMYIFATLFLLKWNNINFACNCDEYTYCYKTFPVIVEGSQRRNEFDFCAKP
jgi:hypothetical protein